MKNRLMTDALREVRRTLSRFLSIFVLSALAVAFLAGLRATAPDMRYSADQYFDQLNLMDVRVLSTLGLTQEDIDALAAQPGVAQAEGSYTVDAIYHGGDNDLILKVHALSQKGINQPRLREGRMPEGPGECLVEPALLTQAGLALGDSLTLDTGDGIYEDALVQEAFTIVGAADWPLYISVERGSSSLGTGKVAAFVLLPMESFDVEAYHEAYLTAEGAQGLLCYGQEYEQQMEDLLDSLEPLGEARADLRAEEVLAEANEKLADAQRELEEAQAEVEVELASARQELEDGRADLDAGWAEYREGVDTLDWEEADGWRKIRQAEADLPDALADLEEGEADYAQGVAGYLQGKADLEDGRAEYNDGAALIWKGRRAYEEGYQTLLEAETEYEENRQLLAGGQAEYDDGYEQYVDGLRELASGGRQLEEAREELEQGHSNLFEGGQMLSGGSAQLEQQNQIYQMQQTAYAQAAGSWQERGIYLLRDTPDVSGPRLGAYLGGLLYRGDMAGIEAFYGQCVAPMGELLAQQRDMAAALGQDAGQLDQILAGLPGSGTELAAGLASSPAGAVAALTSAAYAPAGVLQAMGQAIQEGRQELERGQAALESGRWQYEAGKQQYENARKEYQEGLAQAEEARLELEEARQELEDGWAKLADGRGELDEGWVDLDKAKRDLLDGQAELDEAWLQLVDGARELEEGRLELADGRADLDDGWRQYREGLADLNQAKVDLPQEIAKARRTLAEALADLEEGEAEYARGLAEYEEGRGEAEEELSSARRALNDARREVAELEDCQWYILDRNTNMGYVSFDQDAQRMGNLASVFPVIFFLVAALVCLTTMTRMVEEQRVQIGALKAMGYGKGAVALKYVGYGFAASLLGGLAGLAAGVSGIPAIIFYAWKILYTVGELHFAPAFGISALALGAAVACVTGAALAACFAALRAVPAQLMRPKAPPAGKRVLLERLRPLWQRLTFSQKVTVRNLLRYKRRFWMTVAGIGGCTALIVTGFGLRDSIYSILDKQYDEIATYSANVGLEKNVTQEELAEITGVLEDSGLVEAWMPSRQVSLSIESPSRSVEGRLFAVEDTQQFKDFIHLRQRRDHTPVVLPEEGLVLTEKLAGLLHVGVGDWVTLDGDKRVEAQVAGITENYVFHYAYLTGNYYQQLYGVPAEPNTLLARYTEDTEEQSGAVSAQLISLPGVTSVSRIRDDRNTFTKSMESVDYAVILIICCAAALAFVVLYNLTNINITERMRELATLKVLGFYDRELNAYVYRENVLLTLFGVGLGLVMGKLLHQWLVLTVEIDMVMFGREALLASYCYAVALTLLFSALINLAARRRLKGIDMVESLKTVE